MLLEFECPLAFIFYRLKHCEIPYLGLLKKRLKKQVKLNIPPPITCRRNRVSCIIYNFSHARTYITIEPINCIRYAFHLNGKLHQF